MVDHRGLRAQKQDNLLLQEANCFLRSFFIISNSHRADNSPHNDFFVNVKETVQPWKGQSDTALNHISALLFVQHRELQSFSPEKL